MAVNKNCAKRNCSHKTCKYKQYDTTEKINRAPVDKVLDHLVNMWLLYVHRFLFYFAVNDYIDCEGKTMDVRPILSSTMKRIR